MAYLYVIVCGSEFNDIAGVMIAQKANTCNYNDSKMLLDSLDCILGGPPAYFNISWLSPNFAPKNPVFIATQCHLYGPSLGSLSIPLLHSRPHCLRHSSTSPLHPPFSRSASLTRSCRSRWIFWSTLSITLFFQFFPPLLQLVGLSDQVLYEKKLRRRDDIFQVPSFQIIRWDWSRCFGTLPSTAAPSQNFFSPQLAPSSSPCPPTSW